MSWMTDEVLFYGGIVVAGASAVAAVFLAFLSKISSMRLKGCLDAEYGEQKKSKGGE